MREPRSLRHLRLWRQITTLPLIILSTLHLLQRHACRRSCTYRTACALDRHVPVMMWLMHLHVIAMKLGTTMQERTCGWSWSKTLPACFLTSPLMPDKPLHDQHYVCCWTTTCTQ